MTCKPDYLVLGVSAISFMGGLAGCQRFVSDVSDSTGLAISVGSIAAAEALRAYGGVRRVAFLSPYYPVANLQVGRFLSDCGFTVVRDEALRCESWTDIAQVTEDRLELVLNRLDGDDIDAILQVGTNLSMVRLAARAEARLGKPVVAINAATYWHALRANRIDDRIEGLGRLLLEL